MQDANRERVEPGRHKIGVPLGHCLVDGDTAATSRDVRGRRRAFGLSLAVEASILALLVISPLLTSVAQPQLSRFTPPMIVNLTGWHAHGTNQNTAVHSNRPVISLTNLIFHPTPIGRVVNSHQNLDTNDGFTPGEPDGYIPAVNPIVDLNLGPRNVEPPADVHQPPTKSRSLKLSEGVEQAQMISRVEPRYPVLALQVRKEGTVVLHAIISRDGSITSLEVVSGPALLVQAALDAVRQWRYRPTLLNGEPVEVETTISVMFRLTQ